jgi:hypothetical protein
MVRLLLGLLKGAVIGAGLGYLADRIGLTGGWGTVVYGLIGFVVGLVVGRPIWSHILDRGSTVWTSVLKGLFGFGIGAGLYALASRALGDPVVAFAGEARPLTAWTFVFGGIVGALYGAWVEVDDAPPPKPDDKKL